MRNCVNCKHEQKCTFAQEVKETTSKGLRGQLFSAYKGEHISESWRAVTGGLARTCKDYEYAWKEQQEEFLKNEKLVKHLDKLANELRNNSEFIEEMLGDSFPEYKIEVIDDYVEESVEDNFEQDDTDEVWEAIRSYMHSKFGF